MSNATETRGNPIGLEDVATALHAVRLTRPRPADAAAVVGDGPLALATLAVLLARGVGKVALVADSDGSRARATRAGASALRHPASAEALEQVRGSLGGYGPDFVFECEGSSDARRLAIELVRPAGTVVLVAGDQMPTSMNPNLLVMADKRVQGSRGFEAADLELTRDLIEARRLRLDDLGKGEGDA